MATLVSLMLRLLNSYLRLPKKEKKHSRKKLNHLKLRKNLFRLKLKLKVKKLLQLEISMKKKRKLRKALLEKKVKRKKAVKKNKREEAEDNQERLAYSSRNIMLMMKDSLLLKMIRKKVKDSTEEEATEAEVEEVAEVSEVKEVVEEAEAAEVAVVKEVAEAEVDQPKKVLRINNHSKEDQELNMTETLVIETRVR